MGTSSRWIVLGVGALTFLTAAKTHGRQVRLERELAGYWHVTFGERNPEFVEALWRLDRIVVWSVAAVALLATIAIRAKASELGIRLRLDDAKGASIAGGVVLHLLMPLIAAFEAEGVASAVRLARAVVAGAPPDAARPATWMSDALWGSAGWWALATATTAALVFVSIERVR